jgi:hypothetical protein
VLPCTPDRRAEGASGSEGWERRKNFSSLSASDKRTLVLGAIVAVAGVLSFMDPSGSWGVVVVIGILGGLLAVYVAAQPQMAPSMKMPATKGMLLLAAGGAAALGFVIAGLTWFSYVIDITRVSRSSSTSASWPRLPCCGTAGSPTRRSRKAAAAAPPPPAAPPAA